MHRYKVFIRRGGVHVGRYGSRMAIPCRDLAQAFVVIGQIEAGVAFCDYESLATVKLAKPLVPSQPEFRLRAAA